MRVRHLVAALLMAASPLAITPTLLAEPTPGAGSAIVAEAPAQPLFTTFTVGSPHKVDHSDYGAWLNALTVIDGDYRMVAYEAVDRDSGAVLDAYISRLASIPVSKLNRNEQLAYWLNLHNAMTIKLLMPSNGRGVVDRYRGFPDSTGKVFSQPSVTIEGQSVSPDQIVNNVIRAGFRDPNALYGLFTGAYGSPTLRGEPYTGAEVHSQLKSQAALFINSPAGVKAKGGKIELSSLYQWYAADFGGEKKALEHIASHAQGSLKAEIASASSVTRYRFNPRIAGYSPRAAYSGDFGRNSAGSSGGGGGGSYGGGS